MHLLRNTLLGALLLAALPALAQPASENPSGPITITGLKLKDMLRNFVNSATQVGPTDQLARWDREICPRILGLDETQTEYVFQRMSNVAREVRVKTSKRGCPTMLTIVVTRDTSTIARVIAGDFPSDNIQVRNWLRKFVEAPGPARWITLVDECGTGCVVRECGGPCGTLPNTRLSKATKPKLQAMIILVDSTRLEGVTIAQLADFLSMVALANPPVDALHDRRTILGLFSGKNSEVAGEMTNVDLSLLTSLYRVREEFGVEQQRGSMVTRMAKELRRGNEPTPVSQSQR